MSFMYSNLLKMVGFEQAYTICSCCAATGFQFASAPKTSTDQGIWRTMAENAGPVVLCYKWGGLVGCFASTDIVSVFSCAGQAAFDELKWATAAGRLRWERQ